MSITDHYDYVIIGGGLAGISAALEINRISSTPSPSILIIESNDYLGGRITRPHLFKSSDFFELKSNELLSFDMGAQYIHGNSPENPLLSIISENVRLEPIRPNHPTNPWTDPIKTDTLLPIFHKGVKIELNGDIEKAIYIYDDIIHHCQNTHFNLSKSHVLEEINKYSEILSNDQSLLVLYYICQYEQWMGVPIDQLSINEMKMSDFCDLGDYPGYHCEVYPSMYEGIMSPLISKLEKCSNIHICLNTSVISVGKEESKVQITCENNNIYFGNKTIYTCSIGVLKKHINDTHFFKNFKMNDKMKIIKNLSMGSYVKIYISYYSISNLIYQNERKFYIMTDDYELIYCRLFKDQNTIALTLSPKLSEMPFNTNLYTSICQLIFVNGIDNVERYDKSMFNEKEEFLGAYSCFNKYAEGNETDIISKPIDGLLYFAGEGTHAEYQGSMHSAYLSGQRVAREVVEN